MEISAADKEMLMQKTEYTGVHPQKFALWLAMASMTMFFAALTSTLIVKKGDYRTWESFQIPTSFLFSTITVIFVSITAHAALISYRRAKFTLFRSLMVLSFLLGIAFLALQLYGWQVLKGMGVSLTGNLSGSFVYLITSMHGLHIVVGLLVTLFFIFFAFRAKNDPLYELKNIINPKRELNLEMLVSFWHYIDAVWVYLYIFFILNYQ